MSPSKSLDADLSRQLFVPVSKSLRDGFSNVTPCTLRPTSNGLLLRSHSPIDSPAVSSPCTSTDPHFKRTVRPMAHRPCFPCVAARRAGMPIVLDFCGQASRVAAESGAEAAHARRQFEVKIPTQTKRAGASAPTLCSPSLVRACGFRHPVFRILSLPPRTLRADGRAPQVPAQ